MTLVAERATPSLAAMELTPRQAEFADAALRLVAREGMASVTFRSVAAESGWSLGAVQKAYASKDEIVTAMFARLRQTPGLVPAGEPGRPTLSAWLVDLFCSIMPIDAHRRDLTLQGSAFAERAAYDSTVGQAILASDDELRGLLAQLVRRAQGEGEVSADLDPHFVAWAFLAVAQGAANQLLYGPGELDVLHRRAEALVAALLRG